MREFKGLEYFPIDPKWRVEARLEPYQPPKMIPITNVLSMTDDETSPGALAFEVDGKTYRIDPILEKGETDWFMMIADETTGRETYGAGRYLYVSPPDATGKVVIDFNKAYSPPCAFTNLCDLPVAAAAKSSAVSHRSRREEIRRHGALMFMTVAGRSLNPRSGWQHKAWGEAQRTPQAKLLTAISRSGR